MRFIPHTLNETGEMFEFLGISKFDDLFSDIAEKIRFKGDLKLPQQLEEQALKKEIKEISNLNNVKDLSFCGAGSYEYYIPSAIKTILSRSEFYTAYTPYQAEVSQGTLQAIYEFQSLICNLTGMDVANASMYDGASALAEAVVVAHNTNKGSKVLVSRGLHPEYRRVLETYLTSGKKIIIEEIALEEGITSLEEIKQKISDDVFAVIVQNPNFLGFIERADEIGALLSDKKAAYITAITDFHSLGILEAPGKYGSDIVAGEGQSLGVPRAFGGPYLGILACKNNYIRKLPGRIAGRTLDVNGRKGFTLTLQAREQHIRRDKAVSNICSNQALCALNATVYLSLLGKSGFAQTALQTLNKANYAKEKIAYIDGFSIPINRPFFNEFPVKFEGPVAEFFINLNNKGILPGYMLEKDYPEFKNTILMCFTQIHSRNVIDNFVKQLDEVSRTQKCCWKGCCYDKK